ncbi:MAG: hypothetical protein KH613_00175 [Veillonella sp.]|uniref:hypothetical protein n=1 Tax=Veillonella sp. TaxID=1926307 RepID=UPI001DA228EE|nr:hypothetical protein [Veillonella sp.]MBS6185564.1 hypothetical protein [Veillonella sp.]
MLNFRPITEPFIKLCGDMAEEIKQLKHENAELKEMLESTRHDLFYTREQNRFLSESLADLQREKRKDLEKRVADLEEQLEKKVLLLDDNCTPIKSFTLTGKLTFMNEPAEEKLEVGKWYDARTFDEATLKKLLPKGTLVEITTSLTKDEKIKKSPKTWLETSRVTKVISEDSFIADAETVIYVEKYRYVSCNWFKIIKEY